MSLTDEQAWIVFYTEECNYIDYRTLEERVENADKALQEFRKRFKKNVLMQKPPRPPYFHRLLWSDCDLKHNSFEASENGFLLTVDYIEKDKIWVWYVTKNRIILPDIVECGFSSSEESAKSSAEYEVEKYK